MKQYAGTLIVCVCLGVAAAAVGCDNGGDDSASGGAGNTGTAGAAPGTAGAATGSAGAATATAGASTGTAGAATGTAGSTGTGTDVPLPSDDTGYVKVETLGVQGAWYAYGDGIGADGTAATGNCQAVGKHMTEQCSSIAAPMFGSFPNMNSSMCTNGHVAKVIDLDGKTGCPTTSASCDYSNIFGAGIGLDVNNAGGDAGMAMKLPLDMDAAGVIGISFDIESVPLTGLRVEFPTDTTANTAAIWKPQKAKNYTSPVMAGHNVILFSDVIQPDYIMGAAKLVSSKLVSIQFHVPTTTTAGADYSFCIANLAAVTK